MTLSSVGMSIPRAYISQQSHDLNDVIVMSHYPYSNICDQHSHDFLAHELGHIYLPGCLVQGAVDVRAGNAGLLQ